MAAFHVIARRCGLLFLWGAGHPLDPQAAAAVVTFTPSALSVQPGEQTHVDLFLSQAEIQPFSTVRFVVGLDGDASFEFEHNPALCEGVPNCPSGAGQWQPAGVYETDLMINGGHMLQHWSTPFYLGRLSIIAPTQPGDYDILISPEIEIDRAGQAYSVIVGGFLKTAPLRGGAGLTVVPEPAASALLACGLVAAYAGGRRRRGPARRR